MSLELDHAVIAVRNLDNAIQDYHTLGFSVLRGGIHANRATHNALIVFPDETYLELLAATGDLPVPGVVDFSVLLEKGEGLAGFALRSDDLDADTARLRAVGLEVGNPLPGERRRQEGTVIQWKLALLDGGFAPFLIQDVTPRAWRTPGDPAVTTHPNRAVGLRRVEIAAGDIATTGKRYRTLFGLSQQLPDAAYRYPVEPVVLRASAEAEPPETLLALHLAFMGPVTDRFPLQKTHGVRFERIAPE